MKRRWTASALEEFTDLDFCSQQQQSKTIRKMMFHEMEPECGKKLVEKTNNLPARLLRWSSLEADVERHAGRRERRQAAPEENRLSIGVRRREGQRGSQTQQ
nr:hypothetical protein Iba_chr03eCG7760 [Ipomoea batatas]